MRVCVWQKKGKAWWKPFKGVNWSVEHCVRLHGGDGKKQLSARHSVVVIYCHKKWKHFKMLKVLKITSSRTTSVIHAVKSVSQHLDSVRSAVCQEPWQVWSFFPPLSIRLSQREKLVFVSSCVWLTDASSVSSAAMETDGEQNQQGASTNGSAPSGTSSRPSPMNSMSLYERQAVQVGVSVYTCVATGPDHIDFHTLTMSPHFMEKAFKGSVHSCL